MNESSNSAFCTPFLIASRTSKQERGASARKLETIIRQRVRRIGQNEIGNAIGLSETQMSRLMSLERGIGLDELYDFLAQVNMAVVECDGEMVSMPASEYQALRTLARKGLEQ